MRTIAKQFVSFLILSLVLLAEFNPALAAGQNQEASKFYEDALARFAKKDFAGSIVQLKNALRQEPKMLAAHVLLGRSLLETGAAAQAELEFLKSLQLGVDRSEIAIPLAQAYSNQGKYRRILEGIPLQGLPDSIQQGLLAIRASALIELGELPMARQTLADAYAKAGAKPAHLVLIDANLSFREGRPDAARTLVEQAIKLDPNNASFWLLRATISHSESRSEAALADYNKALSLNQKSLQARLGRVALLLEAGKNQAAAEDLEYLRKTYPEEPRAIYLAALYADRQQDRVAANKALQSVTRALDPALPEIIDQSAQLLLIGGLAHFSLNQGEQAKSYLKRLLALSPNHIAARKLLATVLLKEGRNGEVVEVLAPALAATPNDANVLSLLASAHMGQKDYRKASALLERAVQLGGGAAQFESSFGFSLLGSGQENQGIEHLAQAFRKDPGQVGVGTALTLLYLKRNQTRPAIQIAEILVKHDANNPLVLNLLGVARVAADDRAGGRAAYEKAIAADPGFVPARLNLAKLDLAEGRVDSAKSRLLDILKTQPKNTQAMRELANLEEARGNLGAAMQQLQRISALEPKNIAPSLQLAELYLRQGETEKALNLAKELEGVNSKDLGVLSLEGRAFAALGKTDLARVVYKRMTAYAGVDAASQYKIAQLYLALGDQAAALYNLEKSLLGAPDYLPTLALLAELDVKNGKLAEAEVRARRLIERSPGNEAGYRLLGQIALARGRQDDALIHYQTAYAKAPATQTVTQLARVYSRMGRHPQAAKLISDWLKLHPNDTDAYVTLGQGYVLAGNLAGARAALETVIKQRGENAGIFNNLANILLQQGDRAALEYAEKAHRLAPNDASIADTLGWVLVQQNQVEKALGYLREAKLRAAADPEIKYHLAVALDKLGRSSEARQELDQALSGNTSFPGIEDAKKLRQRLSISGVR